MGAENGNKYFSFENRPGSGKIECKLFFIHS